MESQASAVKANTVAASLGNMTLEKPRQLFSALLGRESELVAGWQPQIQKKTQGVNARKPLMG